MNRTNHKKVWNIFIQRTLNIINIGDDKSPTVSIYYEHEDRDDCSEADFFF
jgi:hypothetical protein